MSNHRRHSDDGAARRIKPWELLPEIVLALGLAIFALLERGVVISALPQPPRHRPHGPRRRRMDRGPAAPRPGQAIPHPAHAALRRRSRRSSGDRRVPELPQPAPSSRPSDRRRRGRVAIADPLGDARRHRPSRRRHSDAVPDRRWRPPRRPRGHRHPARPRLRRLPRARRRPRRHRRRRSASMTCAATRAPSTTTCRAARSTATARGRCWSGARPSTSRSPTQHRRDQRQPAVSWSRRSVASARHVEAAGDADHLAAEHAGRADGQPDDRRWRCRRPPAGGAAAWPSRCR